MIQAKISARSVNISSIIFDWWLHALSFRSLHLYPSSFAVCANSFSHFCWLSNARSRSVCAQFNKCKCQTYCDRSIDQRKLWKNKSLLLLLSLMVVVRVGDPRHVNHPRTILHGILHWLPLMLALWLTMHQTPKLSLSPSLLEVKWLGVMFEPRQNNSRASCQTTI